MGVKRRIRKITEEQKQKIEICLPVFFTGPSYFSYSDFEQLSLEEWKKRWDKEWEEERIRKVEEVEEKVEELRREVGEKWKGYSHYKAVWREELKRLEKTEEFKRLKELKKELKEWRGKGEKKRIVEEKIKPEIIKIQEKIKNGELLKTSRWSMSIVEPEIKGFPYAYKNALYEFDRDDYTDEERILLISELEDKERQKFERLKRKFSLSQEIEETPRREAIPEAVRIAVWRRDERKCAKCGSRKNLEYDHIIPVSKGGGNTVRNIELLCEECNRKKRDNIE